MPVKVPAYHPPLAFRNGHISTIYCGLFRKVPPQVFERERLELPDGDFMDLDWSFATNPRNSVVILLHGLEGDSRRPYMQGSVRSLVNDGYDVCAVNFRGCSGEPNRLYRSYHSGATEDLDEVVQHVLNKTSCSSLFIKGFSLGGNMAFKYAGEKRSRPPELKGIIGISVPCDLHDALCQLQSPSNSLYAMRFLRHLKAKLKKKQQQFPKKLPASVVRDIRNLKAFDDLYTSLAHGFEDAMDYYQRSSCLQFLPDLEVPGLMINAENDSFLGEACYPRELAEQVPALLLETPRYGGHVGFHGPSNISYSEARSLKFLADLH